MKCSWIEPGVLAASSIPLHEADIRSLHAKGVRAILSLTEQPLTIFREITPTLFEQLDLTYCHVPIPDQHPPTMEQAAEILEFLAACSAAERAVFVHCHAGIGRTGTILHLYYLAQGLSLEQAREQVRRRRVQCIMLTDRQHAFLCEYAARR